MLCVELFTCKRNVNLPLLRQELELQRLFNTNTNSLNSNSTIRREFPSREKCPAYISAKDAGGKQERDSSFCNVYHTV